MKRFLLVALLFSSTTLAQVNFTPDGSVIDIATRFIYAGDPINISWCHSDPDVVFDVEIYEYTSGVLMHSDQTASQAYSWIAPKIGHYYVRVRSKNTLATHGNENTGAWTVSTELEQEPDYDHPGCSQPTKRNWFIFADISPPSDGGIE